MLHMSAVTKEEMEAFVQFRLAASTATPAKTISLSGPSTERKAVLTTRKKTPGAKKIPKTDKKPPNRTYRVAADRTDAALEKAKIDYADTFHLWRYKPFVVPRKYHCCVTCCTAIDTRTHGRCNRHNDPEKNNLDECFMD